MTYVITEPAERDIKSILTNTLKVFGPRQLTTYAKIIDKGMEMVGDNPERAGSIDRSEIRQGVRLFHLELAAGRLGAASHCLYYTTGQITNGTIGTIILRVLHEHMEPRYKVVTSLTAHTKN